MQTLNVSVQRDDDGLLITLVCVDRAAAHFRRFRRPTGTTYEALCAEAERMALERWPGGIMWRMALPIEDCGRHG
ncbi:MAG: hypothetical protein AB7D37_11170 [Desulfovibrio sp.]